MTFRTRSAPRPTRRRTRRSDTRRNIWITVVFSLAIVISLTLFAGVFLASYYTAHMAPIAGVNGQGISNDDVYSRAKVDLARYQRLSTDYTTMRNQGKIQSDTYTSLNSGVTQKEGTVVKDALTELQSELEIRQWASQNGVSVTSQQVDDFIKTDSTIPEMRHVQIIGVPSDPIPPASAINQAAVDAAKAKAQGYLDEIKSGKSWADVIKESGSGNVGAQGTTGDLSLVTKDGISNLDPGFRDAIFNLKLNEVTPLTEGTDGAWRFATVAEIVPEFVDADWQNSIASASSGDGYRKYAEAGAIQKAVRAAVEAKYITGPTKQRHVLEISMSAGYGQPGDGDEVRIRLMTFAPKGHVADASSVDQSDPLWAEAKKKADDAVTQLKADPSKFDAMAKNTDINDEIYFQAIGGLVPWIPADLFAAQTQSGGSGLNMPALQVAVFADGLKPGTIVGPILDPNHGYEVAEFLGRRPEPDIRIAQAQFRINSGEDFAKVASEVSENIYAAKGGDMGWISPYRLPTAQEQAIFAAPVGSVTPMIDDSGGFHLYKILEEQTRVQDAAEQANLKDVVFQRWLADLQGKALIWNDQAAVGALASATP